MNALYRASRHASVNQTSETNVLLSHPGERGTRGEKGENGVGERGEKGPAGPIGNTESLTSCYLAEMYSPGKTSY